MWGPEAGRFTGDPYIAAAPAYASTDTTAPAQPYISAKTIHSPTLAAMFGPAPAAGWSIRRITITADEWTYCNVFVAPVQNPADALRPATEYRVTGTPSGDNDEYSALPTIYVPEGLYLVIFWELGPLTMRARVEYVEGVS